MPKIAVTGSNGFIGRHLVDHLAGAGHGVVRITRRDWDLAAGQPPPSALLAGCDGVVHLAAAVHRERETSLGEEEMLQVNATATGRLAESAAAAGIRRFVFLSSAAVFGAGTVGEAMDEASPTRPTTVYGRSKLAAERALAEIAERTGLETVSLRPPLVYGAGAPGNFRRLASWVAAGRPVPSGLLEAVRAVIEVGDLCRLVKCLLMNEPLPRPVYVASEANLLLRDLYFELCRAADRGPRIVPIPRALLAVMLVGRPSRRLLSDFQLDAGAARRELGWVPRADRNEIFRRAMQHTRDGMSHDNAAA